MKKHIDLKNHKVLFGLFSLLFVSSIVQTGAILSVTGTDPVQQTAQVTSAASSCVTFTHNYNQIFSNPFLIVQDTGIPYPDDYQFTTNVYITNGCARPISIIDPGSMNTTNKTGSSTVSYFSIDRLAGNGPEPISPLPGNIFGVDPVFEFATCMNCGQGSLIYRFSPLGTDTSQGQAALRVYTLAVGETRNFDLGIATAVPHSTEDPGWLRARLLRIKWFYTNAYTDSLVTANEVKTSTLTTAQQTAFATDWTTISQDGNSAFMCPVDENPAFNALYEPICQ